MKTDMTLFPCSKLVILVGLRRRGKDIPCSGVNIWLWICIIHHCDHFPGFSMRLLVNEQKIDYWATKRKEEKKKPNATEGKKNIPLTLELKNLQDQ